MQTFQIAAASTRALWFLLPVILIPLFIVSMVLFGLFTGMRARFEVSPAGLRIAGDLYGRTIPLAELRGGSARRLDIRESGEFQPTRRTWGTGLPGYRAGWFRLRNGEKALLYVTDPGKTVYVPTTQNFAVMLSPDDPDGFLSAIRSVAPAQ
jgi:hypothetical protein